MMGGDYVGEFILSNWSRMMAVRCACLPVANSIMHNRRFLEMSHVKWELRKFVSYIKQQRSCSCDVTIVHVHIAVLMLKLCIVRL